MILKNLTSTNQFITVEDLLRCQVSSITLAPHEEMTLPDNMRVLDQVSLLGKVTLGEHILPVVESPVMAQEDTPVEPEIPSESKEEAPAEIASDSFICDICGEEFASARGLSSHKRRVHAE